MNPYSQETCSYLDAAHGAGRHSPHFLGISKASAKPPHTLQQQQRYNGNTTAPTLQTLVFVTAAVILCSLLRAVLTGRYVCNHDSIFTYWYNF